MTIGQIIRKLLASLSFFFMCLSTGFISIGYIDSAIYLIAVSILFTLWIDKI